MSSIPCDAPASSASVANTTVPSAATESAQCRPPSTPPHDNAPGDNASQVPQFCDPDGLTEIRRSLSRLSENLKRTRSSATPNGLARFTDDISELYADTDELTLTDVHVGDGPFDFEKFLRQLMRKLEKADDIHRRELGVLFRDLRVFVDVSEETRLQYHPTVGSLFSTLLNPAAVLRAIQARRHKVERNILIGLDGVVKPGEMLLMLGRPGAGCTTLLHALSVHTPSRSGIKTSGSLQYDSLPSPLPDAYRGDLQYCPEADIHLPTLTVSQTLAFAARTRTPRSRPDGASRDLCVDLMVDVLLTIFGLRHVRDVRVGNEWVRGVSGGQRKRVSVAEVLAMRGKIVCWDNSTRGLDASTALEFVQALRIATDVAHMTTVVSLYQAGEPLYDTFDKVCLLYEGHMVYFGRACDARQYFIDMGYEPKNRQTTADFLVAVTDPHGRTVRAGCEGQVPRTAEEFAAYYRRSSIFAANRADMSLYEAQCTNKPERAHAYQLSKRAEHAQHTRKDSRYIISIPMQIRAVMRRRVQVLAGDKITVVANFLTFVIQAVVMGTVFYRLKNSTSTFYSRGGVLFFAILFSALTTMSEIPALFSQRPVVLRQSQAVMYHRFVESVAVTLVDLPITFITIIAFSFELYFLSGLQETAGQFLIFFLFVFMMTVTMKAWFRLLSAAFPQAPPAQTVAGLSILILVLYTGYTIPQPSMIGALRWITYINPLKYGFEGLMVNEMHNIEAECATLIPQGPGYDGQVTLANQVCTSLGSEPGRALVSGNRYVELAFGYSFSHLWRNFGIICAFGVGFLAMYFFLTERNAGTAGEAARTAFKQGAQLPDAQPANPDPADVEKAQPLPAATALEAKPTRKETTPMELEQEKELAAPAMTDVFSWQHICYTVPMPDGSQRRLLDDVSGFVAPGKLTALMGESGAGKTTLLNVLAERTNVGVVRGDRFVNGHALPQDFQSQTGYCQQLDTHLATSTVREALLFSAKMRQPRTVSTEEKEAYVEKCLDMCGLTAYADAIVGTLNVEYQKRTTIAVELVAKPRLLLFLDEPTSGLDSQSAWAVVAFLRELADKAGQAILCTIHQPSGELFQVFDRLLLLRTGGQTVYFGDIGYNSGTMLSYFERHGARTCGSDENPAEYILQVIGAGATAKTDRDWYGVWSDSTEAQDVQREIEAIHTEGRNRPPVKTNLDTKYPTSWGYQVLTLFRRDMQAHWRDATFIMSKIALNIVAGLFIGFTFFKSKDTLQGTQNKLFSIFMATVVSVPLAQQLQVPFIRMRDLYEVRERPSRMYSWTAFVTSQILAELPWNIFGSSIFFLCWYWTVGYSSEAARAGYAYLFIGVIFPLYYTTVGQAVAAMSPNTQISALLFSSLFSFVLIFNGVLQPFRVMGWWRWMYHVSPYTYLIEGLLGNVIGRLDIRCSAVEFVEVNPPHGLMCSQYLAPFINVVGGYLADPAATSACAYCPYSTTDQYLEQNFSISYTRRWRDVGIFLAFVFFNICATYTNTYIFRIRTGSLAAWIRGRMEARKAQQ